MTHWLRLCAVGCWDGWLKATACDNGRLFEEEKKCRVDVCWDVRRVWCVEGILYRGRLVVVGGAIWAECVLLQRFDCVGNGNSVGSYWSHWFQLICYGLRDYSCVRRLTREHVYIVNLIMNSSDLYFCGQKLGNKNTPWEEQNEYSVCMDSCWQTLLSLWPYLAETINVGFTPHVVVVTKNRT